MSFGLDYITGPPIEALRAAGVEFVCRYIGYTSPSLPQIKILTLNEARMLGQAGIALVSNFEWYANRALEGFAGGVWDAQEAVKLHLACGGPPSAPIYFSVDVDVDGSQVLDYFKGVASVIGLSRTGAYGSYRVIQYLFNAGAITWGWQTYAWSAGAWEPRAQIQQYQNGMVMSGQSVDYDRSTTSDFGQWFPIGGVMSLSIQEASNYFTAVDDQHWKCTQTSFIVQDGILAFYQTVGPFQYNGLSLLGLPKSAEATLKPGVALQRFERGVIVWDPQRQFDSPPGVTGPCYLCHIDGLYSQIAQLEAQVATLQGQSDPLAAQMRAALVALKPLVAQL